MSILSTLIGIGNIIDGEYNLSIIILQLCLTLFFIIGLWALFKEKAPFHNLILIGAFMNLIIAIFIEDLQNTIQISTSILILYFGLRFPISVRKREKTTLKQ